MLELTISSAAISKVWPGGLVMEGMIRPASALSCQDFVAHEARRYPNRERAASGRKLAASNAESCTMRLFCISVVLCSLHAVQVSSGASTVSEVCRSARGLR